MTRRTRIEIYIVESIHVNLSHDKSGKWRRISQDMAGRNRKVLYRESIKAGHNGEISCKNGTFVKISSMEE